MNILWGFAPFLVLMVLERVANPTVGLIAGATIAAAVVARGWLGDKHSFKLLEVGSLVLFAGLAATVVITDVQWSLLELRLHVDLGSLLIVLLSLLLGKPFTLQYAREQAPPELWSHPGFIKTNYMISAAWAAAFVVCIAADLVMIYMPSVPMSSGVFATVLAIYAAIRFTTWYPEHNRTQQNSAA